MFIVIELGDLDRTVGKLWRRSFSRCGDGDPEVQERNLAGDYPRGGDARIVQFPTKVARGCQETTAFRPADQFRVPAPANHRGILGGDENCAARQNSNGT